VYATGCCDSMCQPSMPGHFRVIHMKATGREI